MIKTAPPSVPIHLRNDKRAGRFILGWPVPGTDKYQTKWLPRGISKELAEQMRSEFNCKKTGTSWDTWRELDIETHSSKVQPATIERLEQVYNVFTDLCNPLFLRDIDYDMILKFRSERAQSGRLPGTINADLSFLKAAFNRAIIMGYLDRNPVIPSVGGKEALFCDVPEKAVRTISMAHYQQLMAAAPTVDLQYMLAIGYWAGLRSGEILRLNTFDIDYDQMVLSVLNSKDPKGKNNIIKTGRNRLVIIPPPLLKYLDHRLQDGIHGKIVRSVSVRENGSASRSSQNLAKVFGWICRKAGLVDEYDRGIYTMHSLRKSCITRWIRSGFAVDEVMEMAGHSDIKTTLEYYTECATVLDVRAKMERFMAKYSEDDGVAIG